MKFDRETPIMTQFGVDTAKHDALFKNFSDAQVDEAMARRAWVAAQHRTQQAQVDLEIEVRAVHEQLLNAMKKVT